jgi:hypothetical protein
VKTWVQFIFQNNIEIFLINIYYVLGIGLNNAKHFASLKSKYYKFEANKWVLQGEFLTFYHTFV